jgi:hypothetical protein
MSENYLNYDPAQKRGDSLSETWRDPNKPKLKNIKDEDVAYELRELSKYTSLSPEVINIICHGYARICQLERERDEARKEVCLWQGLDTNKTSEEVAKVRGWDCYKAEFFVGDDDHAKMEADLNNELFRKGQI